MATLTAYQLFYSRVEASGFADIPAANIKRSGYQVVYSSKAIATDVAFIEQRVQCFQPRAENAARYQFFTTPSGNVVISHSCRIEADPEITDTNERAGAFIAHCYVFSPHDFEKIGYNPFVIIDTAKIAGQTEADIFVADPRQMREIVRQQTENVKLSVETRSGHRSSQSAWSDNRDDLLEVIQAGMAGLGGNQTLALMGDEGAIEGAIETILVLADRRKRLNISFDTLVDGCSPEPGAYFIVGTTRRVPNARFVNIDLKNPSIKLEINDPKETGYSTWLRYSLANEPLESTLQKAGDIQEINIAFEEGHLLDNGLDSVAVAAFINVNKDIIQSRFKKALESRFSTSIVEMLYEAVERGESTFDKASIIDAAGQQGFTAPTSMQKLAHEVYGAFTRYPIKKISKDDLTALQSLAEAVDDVRLLAIAALYEWHSLNFISQLFGKKQSADEKRQQVLAKLQKKGLLNEFLTELRTYDWCKPINLLTDKTVAQVIKFVQVQQQNELPETELYEFIAAVIKMDGGSQLNGLTDDVSRLQPKNLKQLQKLIEKQGSKIDKHFAAALEAQLNSTSKEGK